MLTLHHIGGIEWSEGMRWPQNGCLSACASRYRSVPAQGVTSQLAPLDYRVLDWVESTVCSGYAFGFRFREKKREDDVKGRRRAIRGDG